VHRAPARYVPLNTIPAHPGWLMFTTVTAAATQVRPHERGVVRVRRQRRTRQLSRAWRYGPPVADLWVARLHISEDTRVKIHNKHDLDAQEVRLHVECVERLFYTWEDDPERGLRAIVQVWINGRHVLVVLYPVTSGADDEYHLGSAYPTQPGTRRSSR
jgi:hypothetical protein